jgi:hypothetical protein
VGTFAAETSCSERARRPGEVKLPMAPADFIGMEQRAEAA